VGAATGRISALNNKRCGGEIEEEAGGRRRTLFGCTCPRCVCVHKPSSGKGRTSSCSFDMHLL